MVLLLQRLAGVRKREAQRKRRAAVATHCFGARTTSTDAASLVELSTAFIYVCSSSALLMCADGEISENLVLLGGDSPEADPEIPWTDEHNDNTRYKSRALTRALDYVRGRVVDWGRRAWRLDA